MNDNKQYEINLNEIPTIQNGTNKGKFDWSLSINKYVYFSNKHITIKFKIIDYNQKQKKLNFIIEKEVPSILTNEVSPKAILLSRKV